MKWKEMIDNNNEREYYKKKYKLAISNGIT